MAGRLESLRQDTPIKNTVVSSTMNSSVVDIGDCEGNTSMQIVWTGGLAPDITVTLEVSNNSVDWVTVSGTSVHITTAADTLMYDPIQSSCEFLRIHFEVVSGSANFSAYFNGKQRT